jgi:hypothetical protein
MWNLDKALTIGLAVSLCSAIAVQAKTDDTPKKDAVPITSTKGVYTMEGLPDSGPEIEENRAEIDKVSKSNPSSRFLIDSNTLWLPGQTLTVAFNEGSDPQWQADVANTAVEWCKYGNIFFDFGYDASTGRYREWSTSDVEHAADIRITFNGGGYSSQIGTNSRYAVPANAHSMVLGDSNRNLPNYWRRHILHEFGHALGFYHEHVNPVQTCDFKWADDPGYQPTTDSYGQFVTDSFGRRPGVYTVFGGPPNRWSKQKVDTNLRFNLNSDSAGYIVSPADRNSIMHYHFDPMILVKGEFSPCNIQEAFDLSEKDKVGMDKAYPQSARGLKSPKDVRKEQLKQLTEMPGIPAAMKAKFELQLKSLNSAK